MVRAEGPGDGARWSRASLLSGERFLVAVGGEALVHDVVNGMFEDGRPVAPDPVLGVVRAMYMRPSEELRVASVAGGSPPREPLLQAAVGLALAVSVGSLFAVQPLITLAKHATSSLPF